MAWQLLKIQANDQNADAISDALMALGALSASIEDAHAETAAEQAIFGEPGDPPPSIWQQNIVTAMLDESVNIDQLLHDLEATTHTQEFSYVTEMIEEQDWVRATQAQFDPIHITDKLWIVPTWHTSPNQEAINIILDPGLAFGTGSHPTTRLCLEWLTQQDSLENMLDYGCGSGILAIAAKKLGAQQVVGVDIDDQAIVASRLNAKQNKTNIDFFDANEFTDQKFDIVVANILSSALMVLAPALAKYCQYNGKIALSGILEEQIDSLVTRYSEWFKMDAPKQQDAWILLTGIKK
ncbi:MAG: 50S ribosomal protein L11 methyltransferase [Methylophilaceae bacterium]